MEKAIETEIVKDHRVLLSVAPMLDVTDRHFRFMCRLLTKKTMLFTEMVVDGTILHNVKERERFMGFNQLIEHPITIQLGGNNPDSLGEVTSIATEWGYDEVNLNVGCPSKTVCKHCFGARLMFDPPRVRDCIASMRSRTKCNVTVKCRLGADHVDKYEDLQNFIGTVSESGCNHFIIHARKCILNGLNAHQNRTIPPLRYDWVYNIAKDFPHIQFSINGGILTLKEAKDFLDPNQHDGIVLNSCMIGRAAWHNPWILGDADRYIFGSTNPGFSREEVLNTYIDYAAEQMATVGNGGKAPDFSPGHMLKPVLGLFHETFGAANWRKEIHDQLQIEKNTDLHDIVSHAKEYLSSEALAERHPLE